MKQQKLAHAILYIMNTNNALFTRTPRGRINDNIRMEALRHLRRIKMGSARKLLGRVRSRWNYRGGSLSPVVREMHRVCKRLVIVCGDTDLIRCRSVMMRSTFSDVSGTSPTTASKFAVQ